MITLVLLVQLATPPDGPVALDSAVRFEGNHQVDDTTLEAALDPEAGFRSILGDQGVERDVLLLYAAYYDRGFIGVRITQERVISDDRRKVTATFHIDEGEPFYLGRVEATGDALGLAASAGAPGDTFNRSTVMRAKDLVSRRYHDRGHAFALVTALSHVDAERRVVDVTFEIKPGPVVRFGAIRARGARLLPSLPVKTGDLYSDVRIGAIERALARRHLPAQVSVQPAGPTTADVLIDLSGVR